MLQKNYDQLKRNQQQDGLEQQQPIRNKTGTLKPIKEKNNMVIRGVTFYKADEESYKEEDKDDNKGRAKSSKSDNDVSHYEKKTVQIWWQKMLLMINNITFFKNSLHVFCSQSLVMYFLKIILIYCIMH